MAHEAISEDPEILLAEIHHGEEAFTRLPTFLHDILTDWQFVGVCRAQRDFKRRQVVLVLDILRAIAPILVQQIRPFAYDFMDRFQQGHKTFQVRCWHGDEAGTAINDGAIGTSKDFNVTNDGLLHVNSPVVRVSQVVPRQSLAPGKFVQIIPTNRKSRFTKLLHVILIRYIK